MNLYFSEFITGFQETLSAKKATDVFQNANNTSIFPTIESQAKWKFCRAGNRLHLSDGANVHAFELLDKEHHDQDFPLKKLEDAPFHEFSCDGTAQVHKANPGMLYVTLHDGKENPTFTLRHVTEDQWRAIPKTKKAEEAPIRINEDTFFQGLHEKIAMGGSILDFGIKGIDSLARNGVNAAMTPGFNPLAAAGVGLLGGAAYDLGKRTFYNTPEENDEETLTDRALRYVAPAGLLGGMGATTSTLFPKYYNHYPHYKF